MKFKLLFILSLLIISCSSGPEAEQKKKLVIKNCISENNKNVEITWGKYIKDLNKYYSYKLTTSGDIYRVNQDKSETQIGNIYMQDYCSLYISLQKSFLKFQTVRVPADTAVFIKMVNPDINTELLAMWNPVYQTVANKEFNQIIDSLNNYLPKSKILRHRE